jgi:hypothetical protein
MPSTAIYQTEQRNAATEVIETEGPAYYPRSPEQIEGFFAGLELVEPGVVSTPLWRPDAGELRKRSMCSPGLVASPSPLTPRTECLVQRGMR